MRKIKFTKPATKVQVSFSLDPDIALAIDKLADKHELSKSQIFRQILEQWMTINDKKNSR